ncbi:MAG: hypothetical protein AAEJ65_09280 [Planctomycetota bacterium]
MGLIETWMKKTHNTEKETSGLLARGSAARLLDTVHDLVQGGDRPAAVSWLRAGTVRFHPWEQGEIALDEIERSGARETLGMLQDAVELNYTATEAARLSEALERLGDSPGSTLWARAAIQEDPCDPAGYLAIARSYLRRFRRRDDAVAGLHALRYLTKACQLKPGHRECLRSLAMLLLLLRAPVAAAKILQPIEVDSPEDPMVLAMQALTSRMPAEGTTNIQELFLRWETGTTPVHLPDGIGAIPCPDGVKAWELAENRSLIATSIGAAQDADTAELFSVLAGTLTSATSRMGLGEFSKFTARGHGNLLIGLAAPEGMIFCHTDRNSREESLSRWIESHRSGETYR